MGFLLLLKGQEKVSRREADLEDAALSGVQSAQSALCRRARSVSAAGASLHV